MGRGDEQRREVPVRGDRFDRRAGSLFEAAMADEDDATTALRDEMLSLLADLVATGLTDRQRQIVELYFSDGCTQAEIGERLGATRALCGQVLLRTDIVPEDERRRVRHEYDREDDLHRWVPAPVALELVQRWGGPR